MHDALTPWSFGTLMAMTTKVSSLMADGANRILELLAKLAQHGFPLEMPSWTLPRGASRELSPPLGRSARRTLVVTSHTAPGASVLVGQNRLGDPSDASERWGGTSFSFFFA